jgi:hypothetical protein
MPQLDQFTYLTQIVWLTASFLGYYVVLYKYGLPKLSRLLKLRARLVSRSLSDKLANASSDSRVSTESNMDLPRFNNISVELHRLCASYLTSSITGAHKWCNDMVNQLNGECVSQTGLRLKCATKTYIQSLAEMSLSRNVELVQLEKCGALLHSSFSTKLDRTNKQLDRKKPQSRRHTKTGHPDLQSKGFTKRSEVKDFVPSTRVSKLRSILFIRVRQFCARHLQSISTKLVSNSVAHKKKSVPIKSSILHSKAVDSQTINKVKKPQNSKKLKKAKNAR